MKRKCINLKKFNFVSLNNLLKTCEIILIHIPLNIHNENFFELIKIEVIKKVEW